MERKPGVDFLPGTQVAWFDGLYGEDEVRIKTLHIHELIYPVDGKILLVLCGQSGIRPMDIRNISQYPKWYAAYVGESGMAFDFGNPWFFNAKEMQNFKTIATTRHLEKLCAEISGISVPQDAHKDHVKAVIRWAQFWMSEEGQNWKFPD
jgi:hypothetical protein